MSDGLGSIARFGAKAVAFLRRDFLFEVSYKLQFTFQVGAIFFTILTFFFLSRMVGGHGARSHLARYGGDYFTFVLVGISFLRFFDVGLVTFTRMLRQYMSVGVLEPMMATPTRPAEILLLSLTWPFLFELVKTAVFLAAGVLLFGARLVRPDVFALAAALGLSVVVFSCMGLISGSLILLFKRGDPLNWVISSFSMLVGGIVFPVTLLPAWIAWTSVLIPVTHALDALRLVLISGATLPEISAPLFALAVFAAILLPLSLITVTTSVRRAKATGGLAGY